MNFPKISVIVPSYNQGLYLEETLVSIISQQYANLELLIVDGGSTDNSVDIIKKYEDKITWWISEKDAGQSDAINKGFTKATGDIITWLCSDDLYTEEALHKVAALFSTVPEDTGLIYGGTVIFNKNKEIKKDRGYENPTVERYLAGMAFAQPSSFFKKKYLDLVGGNVSTDLHFGMDYDLFARLSCVCRFKQVENIFSRYRLHDDSKSVSQQSKFIFDWGNVFVNLCKNMGWDEVLAILAKIAPAGYTQEYFNKYSFTPENDLMKQVDTQKLLFYHLCYIVKALYLDNRYSEARKITGVIKKEHPLGWLTKEKAMPPIVRNLKYPDFIIKLMQTAKKIFKP